MFGPLNGAPLNGGANGLWLYGGELSFEPVAETAATPLRITYAAGSLSATAVSTGGSTRLAKGWGTAAAAAFADAEGHELVFVSGKSATTADTLFSSWAHRPMSGDADAEASAAGTGVREAWLSPGTVGAEAGSTGEANRITLAPESSSDVSQAVVEGSADRTAWMEPSSIDAPATLTGQVHIARIMGGQSVGEASTSIDYETFWQAVLRPLRTASLSWLAESRIEKLRVRQRFSEARMVIRARTRALPNSKIGRGTLRPESDSFQSPGAVRLYRNHSGVASSNAASSAVPARISRLNGTSEGVATSYIAPDLTLGNTTYCYTSGRAVALSQQKAVGLCITEAGGQAISVSESSGLYVQIHAFTGTASAGGSVPPVYKTRINPWVRVTGQSEATAGQSAYTLRERYITLGALASESQQTAWCYRQVPTWDSVVGTASIASDMHRLAKARAKEVAISAVSAQANVYGWRRPELRSIAATASSQASASKTVWMDGGSEVATAATVSSAARFVIPDISHHPNVAALVASGPDVTRFVSATAVGRGRSDGVIQPHRYITAPSIYAGSQSSGEVFTVARYIDESASAAGESHGGYTRLAYLTPQPAINRSEATGTPHLTRHVRGVCASRADASAYFARYRPASGQAHALAQAPVTIYVWRFFEMRFQGEADGDAEMLRITFIEPARVAESWAETGRVSYLINPDSPAPDTRTITVAPGDRGMSVPATAREFQVA
ncbi:hypothetical protein [Halomonas elongata]|uniref:hypothetical protein n=1 Tax=Halomonas elongata TaxID=2746 RepID=UPI00403318D4